MVKPNYKQQKKQREQAKKRKNDEKRKRKEKVGDDSGPDVAIEHSPLRAP